MLMFGDQKVKPPKRGWRSFLMLSLYFARASSEMTVASR